MAKQEIRTNILPVIALRGKVVFPNTTVSLDAGREVTLGAIQRASATDMLVLLCAQKDLTKDEITPDDICTVGTVAKIKQITKLPSSSVRLLVEGLYRAKTRTIQLDNGYFYTVADEFPVVHGDEMLEEAYFRTAKDLMKDISLTDPRLSKEGLALMERCGNIDEYVNLGATYLHIREDIRQELLELEHAIDRLKLFVRCLNDELEVAKLEKKIAGAVRSNIDKNQKEYFLREQLKAIHTELGDDMDEIEELKGKILAKHLPAEVEDKVLKELARMSKMQSSSPDYNVLRGYMDWIIDLPWREETEDTKRLSDAEKVLNADHYGLEKIKQRITEYLAVLKLTKSMKAPILCLVGPPGVGKTSIARSVARALNRKFVRMSLGGVRDEAEIRGHRRTYVGAMPGRILYAMKTAGSINPVFLLDEIDKVSTDIHGDPASALLEVLDPEQNSTFRDRYLEVPYDLSKVLFIATANTLDTIPAPLLDRMEVIELTGYTLEEKREIAKRYLVPKQRKADGISEKQLVFTDEGIESIVESYTMEAGVRNLERQIGAVCRKVAVEYAHNRKMQQVLLTPENVQEYLGVKRYLGDSASSSDEIGAATGLAWTAYGGTTLTIEVSAMKGKGEILLTGKLGDVMKESARAAISYIRAHADQYHIPAEQFEATDIHIHVPEGATPKDGPSAGITMATAILSAFTQKPVRHDVAMTGEITLRGKVLPIGGLKEKALAAHRIGIHTIIIPEENKKDVEEIPATVRNELQFIYASDVSEVFRTAIKGL